MPIAFARLLLSSTSPSESSLASSRGSSAATAALGRPNPLLGGRVGVHVHTQTMDASADAADDVEQRVARADGLSDGGAPLLLRQTVAALRRNPDALVALRRAAAAAPDDADDVEAAAAAFCLTALRQPEPLDPPADLERC